MNAQAELFQDAKPQITVRDYQFRAENSAIEIFKTHRSTLIVAATGTGKTQIAAQIIKRFYPGRTCFFAHREEIVFQTKKKIQDFTDLSTNIEMGQFRANTNWKMFGASSVVVSTVQTLNSGDRLDQFPANEYSLLVIDECHRACAKSYKKIIEHFKQNPDLKILGLTATPDRLDQKALGEIFETVAFDYEISDAIKDGWLVPVNQQMVNVEGLDFSNVRTTAGDLNGAELAEVMELEKPMHEITQAILEITNKLKPNSLHDIPIDGWCDYITKNGSPLRTLIFAPSVKYSEMLSDILNRVLPKNSNHISGDTSKDDRRRIISDFDYGRIQYLINCAVFTEGWDDKALDGQGVQVIAIARPTKSRALYTQMIGRGLRPLPNVVDGHELDTPEQRIFSIANSPKKNCLVIDFVGNSGRHKLISSVDILGGKASNDVIEHAKKKIRESGQAMPTQEAIDAARREIEEEKERKRIAEEARRAKLIAKAKYSTRNVDPFDVLQLTPTVDRPYDRGKTLSPKQLERLLQQGINPDGMSYRDQKTILNEIFRRFRLKLCSIKQAKHLRKNGYTGEETREQAKEILDTLWRKK